MSASPLPIPLPTLTRRARWPWLLCLIGFLLALAWDRAIFLRLAITDKAAKDRLEILDWYWTFRVLGSFWPWLILAAIFVLADSAASKRPAYYLRRATLLLLSAASSGLAAELLKRVIGRLRPDAADGWNAFKPFLRGFVDPSNLGFPSSHAATAFGAAFALAFMHPRTAPVVLAAAVGCAVTRLATGAHFFSDVYAALLISYALSRLLYALDLRNNHGRPIGSPPPLPDPPPAPLS